MLLEEPRYELGLSTLRRFLKENPAHERHAEVSILVRLLSDRDSEKATLEAHKKRIAQLEKDLEDFKKIDLKKRP